MPGAGADTGTWGGSTLTGEVGGAAGVGNGVGGGSTLIGNDDGLGGDGGPGGLTEEEIAKEAAWVRGLKIQ